MKLYLFEKLNYYIGDNLPQSLLNKAVILETEYIEGKQANIIYDESGVAVEWIDEVIEDGL